MELVVLLFRIHADAVELYSYEDFLGEFLQAGVFRKLECEEARLSFWEEIVHV